MVIYLQSLDKYCSKNKSSRKNVQENIIQTYGQKITRREIYENTVRSNDRTWVIIEHMDECVSTGDILGINPCIGTGDKGISLVGN